MAEITTPPYGDRVTIPVESLEFNVGGNTIWVHSPKGATVLRIRLGGQLDVNTHCENGVSHLDLCVGGDATFCLSNDAEFSGER